MQGSFVGLGFRHTRGHMFRAIMEAIAFEYSSYADIMNKSAGKDVLQAITVVGGGAKSAVFNQIKADILGKPYQTADREDGPLLADAVIAAFGLGKIHNMKQTIQKALSYRSHFELNLQNHLSYTGYKNIYQEQFAYLLPLFHALQEQR